MQTVAAPIAWLPCLQQMDVDDLDGVFVIAAILVAMKVLDRLCEPRSRRLNLDTPRAPDPAAARNVSGVSLAAGANGALKVRYGSSPSLPSHLNPRVRGAIRASQPFGKVC
jgi:hypothetical protein